MTAGKVEPGRKPVGTAPRLAAAGNALGDPDRTRPAKTGGRPVRIAPLARRIAALFYEALLLFAMIIVAGFAFLPFASPTAIATKTLQTPSPLARTVMFCLLVAGGAVFYVWCWSRGRRTLAQKTWRLRLVDRHGAPLSANRALARYAAFWIGPAVALPSYALLQGSGHPASALAFVALDYCWAIVDPDRQFLHDRIAGSVIVRDP